MAKTKTVFASADQFKDPKSGWIYRIPIASNLHEKYGRMEVRLEPILKRGKIERLYLGFRQHEIPELSEPFDIPTPQAGKHTGIMTMVHSGGSFFAEAWMIQPCEEHVGSLQICSYVRDGATALILSLLNTSISVYFEIGGRNG